jgi:hypothetical protein
MNIEYINSLKLITAIIPGYVRNYGKVTIMYLKDGATVKVNFSLYKVLRDYCLIHYLSLNEVKSISKKITGTDGKVPIFIREDKILIAFKVYEKKGEYERTFGYVNIKEIEDFGFDNNCMTFKSGHIIKYYDKKENVMKKLGQGQLLEERIKKYTV